MCALEVARTSAQESKCMGIDSRNSSPPRSAVAHMLPIPFDVLLESDPYRTTSISPLIAELRVLCGTTHHLPAFPNFGIGLARLGRSGFIAYK